MHLHQTICLGRQYSFTNLWPRHFCLPRTGTEETGSDARSSVQRVSSSWRHQKRPTCVVLTRGANAKTHVFNFTITKMLFYFHLSAASSCVLKNTACLFFLLFSAKRSKKINASACIFMRWQTHLCWARKYMQSCGSGPSSEVPHMVYVLRSSQRTPVAGTKLSPKAPGLVLKIGCPEYRVSINYHSDCLWLALTVITQPTPVLSFSFEWRKTYIVSFSLTKKLRV